MDDRLNFWYQEPLFCSSYPSSPVIIFFDISGSQLPAQDISARLREQGVWIGAIDNERMRAVTHLDVSRDDVNEAADRLADVISG